MATRLFRFLGKGLGFVKDKPTCEPCESCDEQQGEEPIESPVQATLNEDLLIEQLFAGVPKNLGVTRADVKVCCYFRVYPCCTVLCGAAVFVTTTQLIQLCFCCTIAFERPHTVQTYNAGSTVK